METDSIRHEKSEYVTWKKLEGNRSILLDLDSGHYYTLNDAATVVWEMAVAGHAADDIARRVRKLFDTDSAPVVDDVHEMLDMLRDKGFLRKTALGVVEPAGPETESETPRTYVKPSIEEHEAVKEITASSCGSSSCGTTTTTSSCGSHYWFPN